MPQQDPAKHGKNENFPKPGGRSVYQDENFLRMEGRSVYQDENFLKMEGRSVSEDENFLNMEGPRTSPNTTAAIRGARSATGASGWRTGVGRVPRLHPQANESRRPWRGFRKR